MKKTKNITFLITLSVFLTGCRWYANNLAKKRGYEGHFDKDWEWVNTNKYYLPDSLKWEQFKGSYNDIPDQELISIAEKLDSSISNGDCFKFIENENRDRFIALFVRRREEIEKPILKYGTIHLWSDFSNVDTIEYVGYNLVGLQYQDRWYYNKEFNYHFYNTGIEKAKEEFIIRYLGRNKFFEIWRTDNENDIWYKREFEIVDSIGVLSEYFGYPEVVAWAKDRELYRIKKELKDIIPSIEALMLKKQNPYFTKFDYYKPSIVIPYLTNWEGDCILFPVIGIDDKDNNRIGLILWNLKENSFYWFFQSQPQKVDLGTYNRLTQSKFNEHVKEILGVDVYIKENSIKLFNKEFWAEIIEREELKFLK